MPDALLYFVARSLLWVLQLLPLPLVARLGRAAGALAYALDARHRDVAFDNLSLCFSGEKSPAELRAIARENFRRIGENFACAAKTASMDLEDLRPRIEMVGKEAFQSGIGAAGGGCIVAIGHFGNFEVNARVASFFPGYQTATTYRAIRPPALDQLLLTLRERSGCLFFERRKDGAALKSLLCSGQRVMLGFHTDQHAGDRGLRLPFFGHICSTTKAPAVYALRYNMPLCTAFCYRTRPGYWRIEIEPEIPTHENGHARPLAAIMGDVNRAFEAAVRRDPANWFWVHNRWKARDQHPSAAPATETQTSGAGDHDDA